MSTAILISGQMRTFAKCYPTQRWQIFRHYEEPETEIKGLASSRIQYWKKQEPYFFVSCVDDAQAQSAELLRQHYANVHIERYADPTDLPEIPIEKRAWAPYANATSHKKLMLQHWGNQKVWQFFMDSLAVVDFKNGVTHFDTIIRIRPDLWIHRFIKPDHEAGSEECLCPWWGKFGGVNDRLGIMGTDAGQFYFNTLDVIPTLLEKGCPFHPETLVAESMRLAGIGVHDTLITEFSTMRMDGSQRWPEIIMSDVAELIATVGRV